MDEQPTTWGPLRRILFRFAFVYLLLALLPFPLNHFQQLVGLPEPLNSVAALGSAASQGYQALWAPLVKGVGQQVFGATVTVLPSASTDTTYNYLERFCHLAVAAAVTAVWTLLSRNRTGYPGLHRGLSIYLRYALAAWMIFYASLKVFKTQFADPGLVRLLQPVGELSPMGLLWTFMGASEGYTVFTGLGELAAGLLLIIRHTALLGALLSAAIMTHVFVLNLCYDVPVKQFSFHLLLVSAFLILPDVPRLANLFLLARPAEAVPLPRLFRRAWLHRAGVALRCGVTLGYAALLLAGACHTRHTSGDLRPRPPLYGIWVVEAFTVDGQDRPPLTTDPVRWQRMIIDSPGAATVQRMNQTLVRYGQTTDPDAGTLTFKSADVPRREAVFAYRVTEPDVLTLEGTLDGKVIRARLRHTDRSQFLLINRGFRWISERLFLR